MTVYVDGQKKERERERDLSRRIRRYFNLKFIVQYQKLSFTY